MLHWRDGKKSVQENGLRYQVKIMSKPVVWMDQRLADSRDTL